ncbi:hypothetical protein RSOL_246900, partial [Rhizoctonia solani AG-3 Rhs1AP]
MYLKPQGIRLNNLGSATTIPELHTGKIDALSAEEASKTTDIINESFTSLYGVKKFSPKEHGLYPTVSKSHLEWPSKTESVPGLTIQSNMGLSLRATRIYLQVF